MAEVDELKQWWMDQAEHEIELTGPKAVEYGSYDLELIGSVLADMIGWENPTAAVKEELGCWFYALGKVARMASAYKEHRLPSDDTPFDLRVYAGMIQRIREAGSWPGELPDFKPCEPVSCPIEFEEVPFTTQRLDEDGQPDGRPRILGKIQRVVKLPSTPSFAAQIQTAEKLARNTSDLPGFDKEAQLQGIGQMWMAENGIGWEDMKRSAERSVRSTGKPVVLHKHDVRTQCPGVDTVSIDESYTSSCFTLYAAPTKKEM